MIKIQCSEAFKLAGFKSVLQVAELAGVSKRTLNYDFASRFIKHKRPAIYGYMRKAMDAKHQEERRIMELAIVEMKKEVEND